MCNENDCLVMTVHSVGSEMKKVTSLDSSFHVNIVHETS